MRATGVGAAIAVTGLQMALQTRSRNPYDTVVSIPYLSPSTAMDDTCVGDTPLVERQPADKASPAWRGFDHLISSNARSPATTMRSTACSPATFLRFAAGQAAAFLAGAATSWTPTIWFRKTVLRAVKRIDQFESRHEGALQAYLRQAIVNRIRDEVRRTKRSPVATELDENASDRGASPLESAIGTEALERYEAALARLRPEEREAIVARVEMDGNLSGSGAGPRKAIGRRGAHGREPGAAAPRGGDES